MKELMTKMYIRATEEQQGFALLEYAAGALVVVGVLWGSMGTLGEGVKGLLEGIGTYVGSEVANVPTATVPTAG